MKNCVNSWFRVCFLLVFWIGSFAAYSEPLDVTYVNAGKENNLRGAYYADVLKFALDKSGVPYTMNNLAVEMTSARKVKSIEDGTISVLWANGRHTVEDFLDPIQIPINGGLLGYKVFIIHQDTQPAIDELHDLEALRLFSMGQGSGWGDVPVLEQAGFTVMKSKYHSLFKMVDAKRFDLFPRGIHEAYAEIEMKKKMYPSLMVDEQVGLHYPFVIFFHVKKGNEALKQAITTGLERAHDDGSFYEFFRSHSFIKPSLERVSQTSRLWFEIENPTFPSEDFEAVKKYLDQELLDRIR